MLESDPGEIAPHMEPLPRRAKLGAVRCVSTPFEPVPSTRLMCNVSVGKLLATGGGG